MTVYCRRALAGRRAPRHAGPHGARRPPQPARPVQLQRDRVGAGDPLRRRHRPLPLVLELRLVVPAPPARQDRRDDGAPTRVARREVGSRRRRDPAGQRVDHPPHRPPPSSRCPPSSRTTCASGSPPVVRSCASPTASRCPTRSTTTRPWQLGYRPDGFLLAVSRLVPEKGLDVLVDALERLAADDTPLDAADRVAGQARQPTRLLRRARRPGRALGHTGAPARCAARADRARALPRRPRARRAVTGRGQPAHGDRGDGPRPVRGGERHPAPPRPPRRHRDPRPRRRRRRARRRAPRRWPTTPSGAHALGARARARIERSDEYQWDGVAARTESVLEVRRRLGLTASASAPGPAEPGPPARRCG